MDFQLNINLDLELKPLKALKSQIKSFKKQQMDDLFNLVKDQKKKEEGAQAVDLNPVSVAKSAKKIEVE